MNYPPMPTTEAEWQAHWAFYKHTLKQRDVAWREINMLRDQLRKERSCESDEQF